jgi:hypothetical protein
MTEYMQNNRFASVYALLCIFQVKIDKRNPVEICYKFCQSVFKILPVKFAMKQI